MDIPGEWVAAGAGALGAAITAIWIYLTKQLTSVNRRVASVEDARLKDAQRHGAENRELALLVANALANNTQALREVIRCLGDRPCIRETPYSPTDGPSAPDSLPDIHTDTLTRKKA